MGGSVKYERDGAIVGPAKSHKTAGWGKFQPIKLSAWGKPLKGS